MDNIPYVSGVVVRGWLWCRVLGLPLVVNICQEARVTLDSVGDILATTIRKLHMVGALGVVAVTALLVAEVIARVVVLNGVIEVVPCRSLGLRGH